MPGGPEELPEDLRPHYNLLATPKQSVIKPKGVFGLREQSESESEPSDEEPVQQLADSSDQKEYSTLSPLEGTTLEEEDPFKPRSEPLVVDPPTPPPVEPKEEENTPPEPPDPITEPMADNKAPSNLGCIPKFKGKCSKAKAFIIDLELYQKMNPKRIIEDKVLISLALQNTSNDAMQWKENELAVSQPLFQSQPPFILGIQCFVACGDSQNHPWKRLMLRAWDVLHLYNPIPYYIS